LLEGRVLMGRSAYICPNENCVKEALKKDRLARALKKQIAQDELVRLKEELECKLR
jgi:uncharacterized protein